MNRYIFIPLRIRSVSTSGFGVLIIFFLHQNRWWAHTLYSCLYYDLRVIWKVLNSIFLINTCVLPTLQLQHQAQAFYTHTIIHHTIIILPRSLLPMFIW